MKESQGYLIIAGIMVIISDQKTGWPQVIAAAFGVVFALLALAQQYQEHRK